MFLKSSGPYSGRRSSGSRELFFFIESAFGACQGTGTDDSYDVAMFSEGYQQKARSTALPGNDLAFLRRGRVIGIRADSGQSIGEYRERLLERDAMLWHVLRGLRLIPLEAFRHFEAARRPREQMICGSCRRASSCEIVSWSSSRN